MQKHITSEEKIRKAEQALTESGAFARIDRIAFENQKKVMAAFRKFQVSDSFFGSTTGYGYNDRGREVLDQVYAEVFESEAAFVRHSITSGTHTLCIGLFGLLRPGDILFSVTGKPYDTLEEVIGIRGEAGNGSLADYGVTYAEQPMKDGVIDTQAMCSYLKEHPAVKVVFIQRSKGYAIRKTLSAAEIGEAAKAAHAVRPDVFVIVDNCYGEFCDEHEPTYYGADMIMGSLIKNPGGGMAECGGYIAGKARAVELCSYRLTCPGIGLEGGATLGQNKSIYKGLFYAPHTVAQSLKTACLAAKVFENEGYAVSPAPDEERHCIIQTISLGSEKKLLAFCRGIQEGAPVDSHVTPEPWQMPGYAVPVVMAAGAFTQGSSIELSADAPCVAPYTVYMQGGLTYESGKIGVMFALENLLAAEE
ncbi:MAG: aminotransferase class I/II-fold pyridoxal phosphate-dependent enzyme [Eubacteriales bacterium]